MRSSCRAPVAWADSYRNCGEVDPLVEPGWRAQVLEGAQGIAMCPQDRGQVAQEVMRRGSYGQSSRQESGMKCSRQQLLMNRAVTR